MEQQVRFAAAADGTELAYALAGEGPPLLFVGGWLSHLEQSWALPAERQLFEGLARGRTLIRFDRPGCGLSGRDGQLDTSLDAELANIAAVAAATGAERFDLMGSSLGVPVAIEWAARNPDTVARLVLYGGWAHGADVGSRAVREHVAGLIRSHWGLGADVLTDIFAPDASAALRGALAEYQRQASSPERAASLFELCYRIDVRASLRAVNAPTIVIHREGDRAAPVEQARVIAAGIDGARLEVLPGRSHLPFVGDVDAVLRAIRDFLGLAPLRASAAVRLTARQSEVAALVARGLTNREIGAALNIEERSAEGHVERIRTKLGLRSRAQVAAWWTAREN